MKLSFAALILTTLASSVSAGAMENLMKVARRLADDDAAVDAEYAFLGNYSFKLLTCKPGETFVNSASGATEYASVVYRLCPITGDCADTGSQGCSGGYGDFVVGINTFVEEYLKQKQDDMEQADDNFKVEDLGECRQYEGDKDADNYQDGVYYYVGPACTSDGTGVKMEMFSDEGCKTPSSGITFEEISNGISLPYSTGGLVSNYCEACLGYNDKGEYGLSDMCLNLYELSGKCESKMESYHYTGKQEGACEVVSTLLPKSSKSGNGGKVVGWLFFVLVVAGVGAFAFTAMKKKKDDKSFGLMT
jgi:hypothetical protein